MLPDIIKKNLKILFVGINPGTRSGQIGHHFAGHSNRFWKFLYESGLTVVKLDPTEDRLLLEYDYGITNIAPRVTATAAELTAAELKEGALVLKQLIVDYHPRVVAYMGKVVYQYLAQQKEFQWGVQSQAVIEGIIDFVIPNPSGLNRMPAAEQLKYYQELKELIAKL
ncbi:MAG TPA: G/U mismatch-specific DNA glycosylase [Bacillota bacterium]|jgi:TDG/mug DNA glycosylase family protein|nr:G/U mismatch-specific DNA glycosylase [Bacillota bacterium]HOL10329.1 G/U mismatch-specific DNA glycosylase [Bacillota bacterium]HPO98081.1 G/U mismatch-specific DNA glycosylase [Bacillota bacterium]